MPLILMQSRLTIRFPPVLTSGSDFWFPLFVIFARLANSTTSDLSYLILAGYALLGRSQVIKAFALLWLLNMINPVLVDEG